MTKSKSSSLKILWGVIEILLAITIICTLAMPAFFAKYVDGSTNYSGSLSMTNFIGGVFDGSITNGWAITAMILYFITLLLSLGLAVVIILNLCGIKAKKMPKLILELLLIIFVSLFLLISIIYSSSAFNYEKVFGIISVILSKESSHAFVSWAPILSVCCGAGCFAIKLIQK